MKPENNRQNPHQDINDPNSLYPCPARAVGGDVVLDGALSPTVCYYTGRSLKLDSERTASDEHLRDEECPLAGDCERCLVDAAVFWGIVEEQQKEIVKLPGGIQTVITLELRPEPAPEVLKK